MRNELPIGDYPIRRPVSSGVTFSFSFEEWEAARAAGLDLHEWDYGTLYETGFKAKVIAWYRLHNLVELHMKDAVAAAEERSARRG